MNTEATRTALEDLLDAFKCGDHERLAARYDDNIDWLYHAPVSIFPFAGVRRGKNEVLAGLALVYQSFQIVKYDVIQRLVDGNRAATLSEAQLVQRETGRVIRGQVASFMRFRDGKMIEYRGFTDSFDSAEQVLGYELDL